MLSNFVKEYRFKNCLTQEELAEKCEITKPTLIAIEQGKMVSYKTLEKLANGTNKKYSYIYKLYQQEQDQR